VTKVRQIRTDRVLLALLLRCFPRPCRLIEAGSNTGHLSLVLAQRGYQITLLDCLQKPIDIAAENFARKHVAADFRVDNILSVIGEWDGVWNSGVLQCYGPSDRSALVDKLCELAPRVLFIYPDVTHPRFPKDFRFEVPGGIDGCIQYPAQDVVSLVAKHCTMVRHGTIAPRIIGLNYPIEYVWGDRGRPY